MKIVMNSRNVAHAWVNQTQNEARTGNDNFWFNGPVLGSYGTAVGYHMGEWILLSRFNFSMTTGKQLRYASTAASHKRIIYSDIFTRGRSYVLDELLQREVINDLQAELIRRTAAVPGKRAAYTRNSAAVAVAAVISDINYVLDAFKSRRKRLTVPADISEIINTSQAAIDAEVEHKAVLRAARDEKERIEHAADIAAWLDGAAVSLPGACRRAADGSDMLTIRGDEVYTSQDVSVPINHVVRALRLYRALRTADGFTAWQKNGHKIPLGVYEIDSIDAAGTVKAGCHRLTAAEIDRFCTRWTDRLTVTPEREG